MTCSGSYFPLNRSLYNAKMWLSASLSRNCSLSFNSFTRSRFIPLCIDFTSSTTMFVAVSRKAIWVEKSMPWTKCGAARMRLLNLSIILGIL